MTPDPSAGGGAGLTEAEELRLHWIDFCDADYRDDGFTDRMESAGLITFRKVKKADVQNDPFAYERGIELGGYLWELTSAGRTALAHADERRGG